MSASLGLPNLTSAQRTLLLTSVTAGVLGGLLALGLRPRKNEGKAKLYKAVEDVGLPVDGIAEESTQEGFDFVIVGGGASHQTIFIV